MQSVIFVRFFRKVYIFLVRVRFVGIFAQRLPGGAVGNSVDGIAKRMCGNVAGIGSQIDLRQFSVDCGRGNVRVDNVSVNVFGGNHVAGDRSILRSNRLRGKPGPVDQALSESVLRVGGGIQPGRRGRRSVYHQSDRARRNQVGIQHLSVGVDLAGNARHQRDHACRRQVPCIKLSGIAVINVVGNGARAAVFLIHTVIVTRQRRPGGAALHGGKPIDTTGIAESIEYGSKQMRIFYAALVISYGYRIGRFYVNGVVVVHRQDVRRPVAAGYADVPNRRSRIQGVQIGLRRNRHRSVRNGAAHFGG